MQAFIGLLAFLQLDTNFVIKNFWLGVVENGHGHHDHGTLCWLYFKKELMESNDFLHAITNSRKPKVIQTIFRWEC